MTTRASYPSKQLDQYMLRMPKGWRDAIKAEAKRTFRPMSGEILAAIEIGMLAKGIQLPHAQNEKDRQGGNPDGLEQSQFSQKG